MKYLKQYMIIGAVTMITSCSDFLDTAPLDALSPATTWKTEDDAQKFAIGCYGGNKQDTSPWGNSTMVAISYISTAGRILDITTLNGKTIRPLATVQ